MHLVHCDHNYIYNFWPREGESIAQAWGRLKSMLYSCPNHELPRETILQKIYSMHLVHRDQNYIYSFFPREGESIALAWGRLKSMLYSCPNHELSREIIIQNFYARLSRNDQTMLDTSCTGSFMTKTIELKWDLLERIKRNSEDWDLEEGKESGITPKFDCVKSFMDTDVFHKFSTKYDLTLR